MTEDISADRVLPAFSQEAPAVIIRFRDSAATLPAVLSSLAKQTLPPARLLGVDTGSRDGSADLVRQAGGDVIQWTRPYSHPEVLNFAVQHCDTELLLALSSHTALTDPATLARLVGAMVADPEAACISSKWDSDPYYSDRITWEEMKEKGLKFGSIYSNSMGMFRRSCWLQEPFDESLSGCEDYAWALAQLQRGRVCLRTEFPFTYERSRNDRIHELCLATHRLAQANGLDVAWMGPRGTFRELARLFLKRLSRSASPPEIALMQEHREKLRAWLDSRRPRG